MVKTQKVYTAPLGEGHPTMRGPAEAPVSCSLLCTVLRLKELGLFGLGEG